MAARFDNGGARGPGRRTPSFRGGQPEIGGLTPSEWKLLERAPRKRPRWDLADVAGKIWNAPNTALGLGYGLAGYAAGQAYRLLPGDQPDPRIQIGNNAVEFIHNPGGGKSAITIGNTIAYGGDPYDPKDEVHYDGGKIRMDWENGHTVMEHERPHTYQGQQLGPFYLPSNLLGGLRALIHDRDDEGRPNWHGEHNWNERGPQSNPPRPWSSKIVR